MVFNYTLNSRSAQLKIEVTTPERDLQKYQSLANYRAGSQSANRENWFGIFAGMSHMYSRVSMNFFQIYNGGVDGLQSAKRRL